MPTYSELAPSYRAQFAQCAPQPRLRGAAEAAQILAHRDRYEALASEFTHQIPWPALGLVHLMEADGNFGCHLHNGDSLTQRTIHVPSGRPPGPPPFTWEASARDALTLAHWDTVPADQWADVAGLLFQLEAYNGWGPRLYHRQRTAYLWAGSNLEQPGKYTADGHWDPTAISKQAGAAVILRQLVLTGQVVFSAPLV